MIWLDEAYIVLGDNSGQVFETQKVDKVYNDDCVVQKFKQSSFRLMVWG